MVECPQVQRHCVVSLSKNINPSLVLVQPRKTHPFITERLLMGHKESNQAKNMFKQQVNLIILNTDFVYSTVASNSYAHIY